MRTLELSATRLLQMRAELKPVEGPTTGQALAQMGELALRLDSARLGLGQTIDSARSAAATREAERRRRPPRPGKRRKARDGSPSAPPKTLAEQKLRRRLAPPRHAFNQGD